ncbi:hypothetical protein D9756_003495 [Leucocoprinus leucothites]|uniref:Uncharacterized protein n=1 Tax=Leucocoprinus leucothites TaxID=201217 RepID=A0A8H5LJK4_9AGAR|nr:hypothetical protein D9756_003495 [Leucoagaricus leucothites]
MYTKLETPTMVEHPSGAPWTSPAADSPGQSGEGEDAASTRCCMSNWVLVPMIIMTFAAFVLLTLTTFSLPFLPRLYFLWSSQGGGVRFGIWGWCLEQGSVCSDRLGMGYTWEPEVAIPITKALALYPVVTPFSLTPLSHLSIAPQPSFISPSFITINPTSFTLFSADLPMSISFDALDVDASDAFAISSFITLIAFIPILKVKTQRTLRVLQVLSWSSFALAATVFVFMIAMWSVADERFKAAGWKVHWGPLPWMSFIATLMLLISAINSLKLAPAPISSSPSLNPPFSAEGWSATAGERQGLDRTDPEKANAPSPSSLLKNVFPPPTSEEAGPASRTPSMKKEPGYEQGHDDSGTSRSSNEIDGNPSHRYRYDSLPYAKARYFARRSSTRDSSPAKTKANTTIDKATTATTATTIFPAIPGIIQVTLPPHALRHDSLQRRERA